MLAEIMPPVLFVAGEYILYTYSIVAAIGLVVGALTAWGAGRLAGWSLHRLLDATIWGLVGGVVGARFWDVVWNVAAYRNALVEALRLWQGGLSLHGGLIGGAVAVFLWCRGDASREYWYTLDLAAIGVSFGGVFLWFGLLVHGAVYGVPVSGEWAWPLSDMAGIILPRFPVQAVGLIVSLILGVGLALAAWRRPIRRWTGALFLVWLLVTATTLFVLGFWRADPALWLGALRLDQVAALVEIVLAAILLPVRWRATR